MVKCSHRMKICRIIEAVRNIAASIPMSIPIFDSFFVAFDFAMCLIPARTMSTEKSHEAEKKISLNPSARKKNGTARMEKNATPFAICSFWLGGFQYRISPICLPCL